MQKWSQPLIWGMVIAVIGPIMASFFGLAFTYFGTLSVVWFAVLLWFSIFTRFICSARDRTMSALCRYTC
jgi:hypothetical protein